MLIFLFLCKEIFCPIAIFWESHYNHKLYSSFKTTSLVMFKWNILYTYELIWWNVSSEHVRSKSSMNSFTSSRYLSNVKSLWGVYSLNNCEKEAEILKQYWHISICGFLTRHAHFNDLDLVKMICKILILGSKKLRDCSSMTSIKIWEF